MSVRGPGILPLGRTSRGPEARSYSLADLK